MTLILHLTPAAYFNALPPGAPYLPAAYPQDGFIHCTKEPEVMLSIANRFYKDLPGELLVLVIDTDRVTPEVKWEAPAHPDGSAPRPGEAAHQFPHIYGPLNREAIVEIHPAHRAPGGAYISV
jgi:uncharacterized protein (DUF952 family)